MHIRRPVEQGEAPNPLRPADYVWRIFSISYDPIIEKITYLRLLLHKLLILDKKFRLSLPAKRTLHSCLHRPLVGFFPVASHAGGNPIRRRTHRRSDEEEGEVSPVIDEAS
jgi:hypothetical protein